MNASAVDGLVMIALLAGSAMCVAGALWFAHRLGLPDALAKREPQRLRGLRTGLGLVALGACVAMLTGAIPGVSFLHGWTSMACIGCAFLGMLTVVGAQRAGTGQAQLEANGQADEATRKPVPGYRRAA